MKQTITKKQWKELSKEKQDKMLNELHGIKPFLVEYFPISIGQMIEFLKNDLCNINCDMNIESSKAEYNARIIMYTTKCFDFETKWYIELVDALWEAVKYKLNN